MKRRTFYNKVSDSTFDIIDEFLNLMHSEGIEYCVIGGVAMNAYCEPLLTLDFDCVVDRRRVQGLKKSLSARGYKVKTHPYTYEVTHPKSDIRIQVQRDARYQNFLKNAVIKKMLDYRMKVAKKEDLLAGKIWASQDKTRNKLKREKDLLDIHRLTEKYPGLRKLVNK